MNQLLEIIDNFAQKKILVVGDLILDKYIWGEAERISPEAPVPVVEVVSESFRFGGAANVANNLRSLGAKVYAVGVIGQDQNGGQLRSMLLDTGVEVTGLFVDEARPTSVKTRVLARNQQIVRIDRESKQQVSEDIRNKILSLAKDLIPMVDGMILEDYNKGVIGAEVIREITAYGKRYGKLIVVDPKVENFWNYYGVTAITPNMKETSGAIGRSIEDEESLTQAGIEIVKKLEIEALLITRGEHGMTLFERAKADSKIQIHHIPTIPRPVYDVTGAGDTVVAVFTLALATGASMLEAAYLSNCAGGIVVQEIGTASATPQQLRDAIEMAKQQPSFK